MNWTPPSDWTRISTVDAHAAGEPLRVVTGGIPPVPGDTILAKRRYVRENLDHLRRALMFEPRGHADMYGCILTEPVTPDGDFGVLFMHNEGYSTMCGHGVIAVTTIALQRGLILTGGVDQDCVTVVYDSPAGTVRARARLGHGAGEAGGARADIRIESVAFVNVPSFVLLPGVEVNLPTRRVRADVAFGGAFYAIVDSEAVGLPIDAAHLPELRRVGMEIKHAIEATQTIVHPSDPGLCGIYGTIFTAPPNDERADLRNVTVFADAEVDRSPCGTGTCAVMAVLDAMGLIGADAAGVFRHESLIGTRFTGRVAARTTVGEYAAIVPEIEGSAWITGEHTFLIDENDPLKDGFRI